MKIYSDKSVQNDDGIVIFQIHGEAFVVKTSNSSAWRILFKYDFYF